MRDFWASSGFQLLDRDADGRLVVTDEFLKAYLARPELMPPPEACEPERALHRALLADPRRAVGAGEIAALADADARENWALMIAFRDRLLSAPSLEAAYLDLVRGGMGGTPPLFVDQLAQVILRNALDGVEDGTVLRAAEVFFRPQRTSLHKGALLLADAETVEQMEEHRRHASPLLLMLGDPAAADLDVLGAENAATYFDRDEKFDLVLSFAGGVAARAGLARVVETWVRHLLGVSVGVEPVARAEEADWAWVLGLDADATRIGNRLWRGEDPDPDELGRIIGLFALRFDDPNEALPDIGARPVWLLLATQPDGQVRMKPQNLVAGLPLRSAALSN